jgi:phosphate transport system permease protein
LKLSFRKPDPFLVKEKAFSLILLTSSLIVLALLVAIFITLPLNAFESIKEFGFGFIIGSTWDPVQGVFGALPFIAGTLLTSFLSLALSIPFSLAIALFLGEYYREGVLPTILKSAIELLAGIPSIIYGFWGIFILVPIVMEIEIKFGVLPYGVGIFTSSLVLTIMIIPYAASMGREVIQLVPKDLKEAAYSLGATKYEVIRRVVLPIARSGILAGMILALGRALGETMAVTMLIGNTNSVPTGIFSPANTMASLIANEFTESGSGLHLSSIIEIGLVLFIITMIINLIGRYIIHKTSVGIN